MAETALTCACHTMRVAQPPSFSYSTTMPDDLYDHDILAWSRHQAELLRRMARGERVNDVDWQHVVEEIEDVGLSELNAVRSHLRLMLVHLLKVHGWPNSPSVGHWRGEIVSFQNDAAQRFAPSMRRRIDLARLYRDALRQLEDVTYDDVAPLAMPSNCPVTLKQLLNDKRAALEDHLHQASRQS
jgi:hypothetical protein